jgi:hypothetical protein
MPKSQSANHPQLYDPSQSSTARNRDDLSFNITYAATGDWAAGRVVDEKVTIAGATVDSLAIGVATSVGELEYDFQGYAGVIGMSFLNLSSSKTYLSNLATEALLMRTPHSHAHTTTHVYAIASVESKPAGLYYEFQRRRIGIFGLWEC